MTCACAFGGGTATVHVPARGGRQDARCNDGDEDAAGEQWGTSCGRRWWVQRRQQRCKTADGGGATDRSRPGASMG